MKHKHSSSKIAQHQANISLSSDLP